MKNVYYKLTKQIKSVAVIEHYLGTVFADKSACWVLISELNLEVPFQYKIQSWADISEQNCNFQFVTPRFGEATEPGTPSR